MNRINQEFQSYKCYYYGYVDGVFIKNTNVSCWKGIVDPYHWRAKRVMNNPPPPEPKVLPKTIYIDITNRKISVKDIKQLVLILNKITKCSIVEIDSITYIQYDFICNSNYKKNLLLLNFIRMIWYQPHGIDLKAFFKSLHSFKKRSDVVKFLLTRINKNMIKLGKYGNYGDHSIVIKGIKPKSTKHFMSANIIVLDEYLIT